MTADPTSALALLALACLLLLGGAAWLAQPWVVARRRERIRAQPFPAAWRRILRRRVPLVARLPAPLQLRLKGHMQVFLARKPLIRCQPPRLDAEKRLALPPQARLLLLRQARPHFLPPLRELLLYPAALVRDL